MEDFETLNGIIGGLAVIIAIGAFLMMFTTVFTTKR